MTLELSGLKKVRERREATEDSLVEQHGEGLFVMLAERKEQLEFAEEQFQSDLRAIEAELENFMQRYQATLNLSHKAGLSRLISAIHSAIEESEK